MHADQPSGACPPLTGEVVFIYAFDIAYDMQRAPLHTLLGCPLEPYLLDARKHGPRGQTFYRPLMARLPVLERPVHGRPAAFHAAIKVLPIGALSVTVRTAVAAQDISGLGLWHEVAFDDGTTLHQWVTSTVEQARAELAACAVRPHARLPEPESYTVFCLDAASPDIGLDTTAWLERNRSGVAMLLTREQGRDTLSAQEIAESTSRHLTYYRHDLAVADWDAALLIDRPGDWAETLYVMELANIQLEELEAYDAFLDEALERACRDLTAPDSHRRRHVLREVQELRIDLARFSDELSNITKFFGEWHLARVYETTARLFHLSDWHRGIDAKLHTLDRLYDMLKQDRNHRIMLWLEASIVVMFLIDLLMLFTGRWK